MKVVILCGGFGTRIRDVAEDIPKPMIPVGNYPILWHIMKYYSTFGHNEFILCLGYKGREIKEYFLNYENSINDFTITLGEKEKVEYHNLHNESGWKITFAETGLKSMTGARIKKIQKYISPGEGFMLTYGDGLADVNLNHLIEFHKSHQKIMTLTGVRPAGRFGELGVEDNGLITEFNEKPQTSDGRINGGYFVCNYDLFDYLDERPDLVFEKQPVAKLVEDEELMQFPHDGFWQPMDTSREYILLNDLFEKGRAPWVKWSEK
jgi:glucose-1-phosphate cytidylyltransferase